MSLNPQDLIGPVLGAVKPALGKAWSDVEPFAATEATKLAHTLANIAALKANNQINEDQASALLDMQKQAMQSVLLAVEGIGLIAAQNAINAALGAIKDVVNKALGFALIG
jgi:hypothetical protein